ncbi:uncharacterized protein [Amphiura filiformis]|uniref:uncharacterized protein n=1 Tax=Amphiura filiformis TaxID=82378 RepID=UPI003B213856
MECFSSAQQPSEWTWPASMNIFYKNGTQQPVPLLEVQQPMSVMSQVTATSVQQPLQPISQVTATSVHVDQENEKDGVSKLQKVTQHGRKRKAKKPNKPSGEATKASDKDSENKKIRKRAPNWKEIEITTLASFVQEHKALLFGSKKGNGRVETVKREYWERAAKAIRVAGGEARTG